MKVVCIGNWGDDFTIGKIYEVEKRNQPGDDYTSLHMLITDGGNPYFFTTIPKDKFITIDEYRENQLNKILK